VDAARLEFREAFRDVLATVVADGVARGVLPAQDARLTAAAVVGAVGEALVGPLSAGIAADPASRTGGGPGTIPSLVTFALRAIGGCDVLDP
jgi:hypothetical protein